MSPMSVIHLAIVLFLTVVSCLKSTRYEPTWASLDSRPLPLWYDQGKVGIFVHWGVFSVPSFKSEWFWWYWQGQKLPEVVRFMQKNYRPDFTYADFAADFTAELFNPDQWADIFQASGASHVVLTSKHHEGFCNWNTSRSYNWNSVDVGPNRNLVGDLAASIRSRTKLRFGLYHSLFEWFNPLYLSDAAGNFSQQNFVKSKSLPELYELVNTFKPDVVWSDGDAGPDTYWNSTSFLAWLYNDSPVKDTVVTNDRWGNGCGCKHGGFYTCDDRYNPGHLLPHKWENCFTLDKKSWGFRREATSLDYMSIEDILYELASTVSCGGNVLINVGPRSDGMIDPIMEERLRQLGSWLNVNGEAIYSTKPWKFQNDTVTKRVWYTSKGGAVYSVLLDWPVGNKVVLGAVKTQPSTVVTVLGLPGNLSYVQGSSGVTVTLPELAFVRLSWAWVLKFTSLQTYLTYQAEDSLDNIPYNKSPPEL